MATFERPKPKKGKGCKVPCCPNHGEPLEGLPTPMTTTGVGMCPISGARFEYKVDIDAETTEYIKDHNGVLQPVPVYKLTGDGTEQYNEV